MRTLSFFSFPGIGLLFIVIAGFVQQVDANTPWELPDDPETNYFEIITPLGRIVIHLYDETPAHRDNFRKLVADGFFDGIKFHRIIRGYMIQGGDPNSKDDRPEDDGLGGPGYTVPAEFVASLYHKRGALAAARQGDHVNPERNSSGSQFYIVQGMRIDSLTLDRIEQQIRMTSGDQGFRFLPEIRRVYQTVGGAPNLDGQYTVFGELVEGFDVLDRIAESETPRQLGQQVPEYLIDRPIEDIPMEIRALPDYRE